MNYVLDTNSFLLLQNYYPNSFSSFWDRLDALINEDRLFSVREVFNELEYLVSKQHMADWIVANKSIFRAATREETAFVAEIFAVPHFSALVGRKQLLKGSPVADPFVVASAKVNQACVVSEEIYKPNAAKIPNVCEYFEIDCINLEEFLQKEQWSF